MKYKGKPISGPRKIIVPILRNDEEGKEANIIFEVQAVVDMESFELICPQPTPPVLKLPNNKTRLDVEDKGYKDEWRRWFDTRTHWCALKSLESTKGVEWETVNFSDPTTYSNWEKELKAAGFSSIEMNRINNAIIEVNGLNENLVEEARQSFLTSQAAEVNGQSSHKVEVPTT